MIRHYLTSDYMDPTGYYYSPIPENPTKDELEKYQKLTVRMLIRSFVMLLVMSLFMAIVGLLTSCSPSKELSSVSSHRIETLMERMDSVISTRTVIQQDSSWRETILKQFQSIREKSDTSHYVVVDSAGKVIKETLVINNVRETTSETDRQEIQFLSHRIQTMDSTMNLMRLQIQHSDSLLQQRNEYTVKEVDKPLNWWQQLRVWLGNLVLVALLVAAAIWALKKKTWWLSLLRKIIG